MPRGTVSSGPVIPGCAEAMPPGGAGHCGGGPYCPGGGYWPGGGGGGYWPCGWPWVAYCPSGPNAPGPNDRCWNSPCGRSIRSMVSEPASGACAAGACAIGGGACGAGKGGGAAKGAW